jgi:hypothetical protein
MDKPAWLRFLGALVALAVTHACASPLPLRNGGFEEGPADGVPPGWQRWGHDAARDPRDFAADNAVAHSGGRSLRIRHPEGAHGYIVTAVRDNLIPVRSNRAYAVSFFAKADRPGLSGLRVEAHRAGDPLAARTVWEQTFEAGEEWRRIAFTVTEGQTFFHDEYDRLMLAIYAVPANRRQPTRTLWVDDVTVEEQPVPPEQVRLLNPKTLAFEPLQHRLKPGDALDVTLHADRPARRTTLLAGGVSFHRASGYMGLPYDRSGEYRLSAAQEESIRALRLPFTRFYAVGDEAYPLEQALDKIAAVLARCAIPQDGTVLELEAQGASTKLAPETWARGVRHCREKGYAFRHWEVSNEPWGKPAFPKPDDYVAHLKSVGAAVRQADPESLVGVGIHYESMEWGNYVLAAGAGHYDFVCGHWYSFINAQKNSLETVAACENYRLLTEMLRLNALLRRYNPGRDVCQYDTEWSLHSNAAGTVPGTPQNGNIVGALHRVVRLIYSLREDIVRGASAWEMFSSPAKARWNSLGLLAPDEERQAAIYWAHRCVNNYAGAWALAIEGTTPFCAPPAGAGDSSRRPLAGPLAPMVAMRDEEGRSLSVIAANVSAERTVPCTLRLSGFTASSAAGVRLSQPDLDAHPLLARHEDLVTPFTARVEGGAVVRCELPPKSAVFLRIEK